MKLIPILIFILAFTSIFAQKNTAIFLHHSTGYNVYNQGNVSNWINNYNLVHGTNFSVTKRAFPDSPWPWENYPYDYWKLWVNNTCNNSNPNIECLASIASNCGLVIYKHCFPGASVGADTGKPDISSNRKSLENYKLQYRALRTLMDGMPEKKFMVWTLVPLHRLATNADQAKRAKEFVNWVKSDWLTEDGNSHPNIFIFDFFSLAAEQNVNPANGQQYCLKYEYEGSHTSNDSHPNTLANQTIGPIFAEAVVNVLAKNYFVASISVSSLSGLNTISNFHGTLQMQATILPTDAFSKSVTWNVINLTGKASINSSGLLTAETNGTVLVVTTANDGSGITGELQVNMTNQEIPIQNITINSSSTSQITSDKGTIQLSTTILPEDASSKSVNWSIINETGQATISPSGLLTAQKDGTVKAVATATDGSGIKGELQITISNQVIPVESITLSSTGGNLITTDKGTLQLDAAFQPLDASNNAVIWSVVNVTGQAAISSSGLLTAQKNGTVKAIATANDGSGIKGELQITISNQISSEKIQLFNLNFGWNIISAWITPTNPNIQNIFQELINAGKLVKIIDESGKTLEDFGTFGGWKNDIGNLSNEKGYKVNVSESVILNLQGTAVPLPIDINLHEGWNIICFPSENEQDAMNLFQPLIDSGKLIKVMNEAGYSIENFALWGGWKNNIGNLKPNKGYKVNMSSTGSITIPPNGFKLVILPPGPTESEHFRKVFIGNGTDHMNINLVDLIKSGFEIGDEIGIFDGDFCVGSATIDSKQIVQDFISIPASRNDDLSISRNGYITNNPITIKLYRNAQEYLLTPKLENNSTNTFIRGESMFATANAALATNITQLGKSDFIKCYPTPFTDQISIEIATSDLPKLDVKIYDANGRLIRNLYQGNAQIKTILIWDGKNDQGVRMKTGNYFLKVNDKVEKILLAQ